MLDIPSTAAPNNARRMLQMYCVFLFMLDIPPKLAHLWPFWCHVGSILVGSWQSWPTLAIFLRDVEALLGPGWHIFGHLGAILAATLAILAPSWPHQPQDGGPINAPRILQMWCVFLFMHDIPPKAAPNHAPRMLQMWCVFLFMYDIPSTAAPNHAPRMLQMWCVFLFMLDIPSPAAHKHAPRMLQMWCVFLFMLDILSTTVPINALRMFQMYWPAALIIFFGNERNKILFRSFWEAGGLVISWESKHAPRMLQMWCVFLFMLDIPSTAARKHAPRMLQVWCVFLFMLDIPSPAAPKHALRMLQMWYTAPTTSIIPFFFSLHLHLNSCHHLTLTLNPNALNPKT